MDLNKDLDDLLKNIQKEISSANLNIKKFTDYLKKNISSELSPSILSEVEKLEKAILSENVLELMSTNHSANNFILEKIEKPNAEAKPNIKPLKVPNEALSKAIIIIPIVAIIIAVQTLREIFSLKNKNPSNAVINGIAAKHNNVIAAVVLVIDQIKVIIAEPRPIPPITPGAPIFK